MSILISGTILHSAYIPAAAKHPVYLRAPPIAFLILKIKNYKFGRFLPSSLGNKFFSSTNHRPNWTTQIFAKTKHHTIGILANFCWCTI